MLLLKEIWSGSVGLLFQRVVDHLFEFSDGCKGRNCAGRVASQSVTGKFLHQISIAVLHPYHDPEANGLVGTSCGVKVCTREHPVERRARVIVEGWNGTAARFRR